MTPEPIRTEETKSTEPERSLPVAADPFEGLHVPRVTTNATPLSPLSQQGLSPVRGATSFADEGFVSSLEHPLVTTSKSGELGKASQLPPRPRIVQRPDRLTSRGVSGAPMSVIKQGEEAEDLSYMSSDFRNSPRGSLGLSDLMSNNPLESEAEAYIQRSLDEIDPTKAGPSEAQQTILGFVPDGTTPETFQEEAPKVTRPTLKRNITKTTSPSHNRTKSTAEHLYQLSNDLTVLNKQHGMGASLRGLDIDLEDEGDFTTDQDMLMKNAATLMKRNNVTLKDTSAMTSNNTDTHSDAGHEDDITIKQKPTDSSHDRWNILKNTVQGATQLSKAFDTTKKMDEPRSSLDPSPLEAEYEHDDEEGGLFGNDGDNETIKSSTGPGRSHAMRKTTRRQKIKSRYKDFEDWLKFKKMNIYSYVKFVLFFLILPATGVAAILFYWGGNPPCGTADECNESNIVVTPTTAPSGNATTAPGTDIVDKTREFFEGGSASWWILFVCCRQPVTLSLALATQAFFVEFLALRTKWAVKLVGPFVTLFIVQSKGWPFILFWWGIFDFCLLYGSSKWAQHWLYWQDYVGLFNEDNPSGNSTSAPEYRAILIVSVGVSAVVAVKRFWVGFWFGKKTFHRYAEDLTTVMKKSLLIGQVAGLARDKESLGYELEDLGLEVGQYEVNDDTNEDDASKTSLNAGDTVKSPLQNFGPSTSTGGGGLMQQATLSSFQKVRINELLGAWEEPDIVNGKDNTAPIGAIIQFRQSLSYLNTPFPFSVAFGSAGNRKECIMSVEAVYNRLIGNDKILRFDLIALLAVGRDGEMDEDKLKALIKLFRPERDGTLSLIDFAKSVDSVYKELRLLRASVANSTKMDASFERIFNVVFYFVLVCVVLAIVGIDPIVLFASISGFVLGFAFIIGAAASKYFEGVLFIIARRPYDIGDRINVSNPMIDTPTSGSPGWIVKDVDLFTTTVLYLATNETATYSNSSLAACRIINGARSYKAAVSFLHKFPLDAPYKKLQVFKGALESFIKARPREWGAFVAFRATRVEVDLGFVEYIVVAEHRESWQQAGIVNNSKAELTSFSLELSKKMNMRYRSPPMPIDLSIMGGNGSLAPLETIAGRTYHSPGPSADFGAHPAGRDRANTVESVDWQAVSAMFDNKK